jgi:hypothetical protein
MTKALFRTIKRWYIPDDGKVVRTFCLKHGLKDRNTKDLYQSSNSLSAVDRVTIPEACPTMAYRFS